MDARKSIDSCGFDLLFKNNVPHILEKLFLSLDYESYKNCIEVSYAWNNLLTSESYLRKAKSVFHREILKDEKKLWEAVKEGQVERIRRLLSSGMLEFHYHYGSTPLHWASRNSHEDESKSS